MTKRVLPTPEELRKLLRYEHLAGLLFWRERTPDMFRVTAGRTAEHACNNWNSRYAGKEALRHKTEDGYLTGRIFDKPFKSHRVIWAMVHGEWPEAHIDHINHDKSDNRIDNIRSISHAENQKNKPVWRKNKSGVNGVSWRPDCEKWVAQISTGGKNYYLGLYSKMNGAIKARAAADIKYGFHKNHGNVK